MKPQLKSSPAARDLILRFEPYRESAARGADGRWSVGFGHRTAAREGVKVSRDDASLLLIYDVMQAAAVVDELFTEPLPKLQRDALTSFVHDVGALAFRQSDVARYLFEGRVEAAAEALAGYGDGNSERREAESAMLLAGRDDADAVRKPAMVELVIRVEQLADETRSTQSPARPRPALPDSLMPPPPPPLVTRQATARREAEGEIARILATVGAMPLDDEPSPAETEPTAAIAEPVAEAAPASEITPVPEPEIEVEGEPIAAQAPLTAETDLGQPEPDPEIGAEALAEAEFEPELDESVKPDTGLVEAEPQVPVTEINRVDAPVSAQVIARMTQEIAHVQTAIVGREASLSLRPTSEDDAPGNVSLGYVFTGSMRARLAPAVEAPVAEPETELPTAADATAGATDGHDPDDLQTDSAQTAAAGDEAASGGLAPDSHDPVPAAAAIVERTLAVGGHHTRPPHPETAPAGVAGVAGDVAAARVEDDSHSDADRFAHVDELAGPAETATLEADEDDPFSPGDLVGTTDMFVESGPISSRKEEGGWGFLVTLIAGLVVTGAGALDVYGDWPRVWVERDPTWGVMASVAGAFLVVTASWMLASVLAARHRKKRGL